MREGVRRTLRRLSPVRYARARSRPLVLLYHRIASAAPDPQLLSVDAENFAEHLALIADRSVPMRLTDLVVAAAQGDAPSRAVALAFDDGYADNLLAARPLLERFGVPATVFVASGYVRSGRRFWWDELEVLLLRPGRLPALVTLEIGNETVSWELGADATYTSESAAGRSAWTVLDADDAGPRQRLYRELCARLRALNEGERERVLERLRSLAALEPTNADAPRPLSSVELTQLAGAGLVEIGAHTISHPVLSLLPAARQREEIAGSKVQLEHMLGRPVSAFAYPYGAPTDFDETSLWLVREAGFAYACANVAGRVTTRTDRYRIPRLLVRDWSADELGRHLG